MSVWIECIYIVTEHLDFMTSYKISVEPELRYLSPFYWLLKLHKKHMVQDLLLPSISVVQNLCQTFSCLSMISSHFKQYCIYRRTGGNCFWIIDNSRQVLSV